MELSANARSLAGLLGGGAGAVSALGFAIVPQGDPLGPAGLDFADYEKMKSFQGGICVNTYLSQEEKALLNGAGVGNEKGKWKNQKDKFKSPRGHTKGCVAIAWDKETWEGGKWKGAIRYEWLYTIGDETLVTYGLYITRENTKIEWRTIYVNKGKKENDALLWEGSDRPKFSRDLNTPDFDQICKENHECIGGSEQKNKGEVKWTWYEDNENGRYKFSDWSTNFSDAFSSLSTRLVLSGGTSFDQLVEKKGVRSKR